MRACVIGEYLHDEVFFALGLFRERKQRMNIETGLMQYITQLGDCHRQSLACYDAYSACFGREAEAEAEAKHNQDRPKLSMSGCFFNSTVCQQVLSDAKRGLVRRKICCCNWQPVCKGLRKTLTSFIH